MSDRVLVADWPVPNTVAAGVVTRLGSAADLPAAPRWLEQVHGDRVVRLGSDEFAAGAPAADAVIGAQAGDLCVVRTADCLPVLLASADGQEIAAVHAGWRGLAAGVIDRTVERFASPPGELAAWLGPAIGQDAFEVGDEVRTAFATAGFDVTARFRRNHRNRWQADLFGLAKDRLRTLGLAVISGERICTHADAARFFSYRRDGASGRMLNFVHRR